MADEKKDISMKPMSPDQTDSNTRSECSDSECEAVDTRCGLTSSCKPQWLQRLANAKVYLVVISMCTIIQGFAINGINNVDMSSYERRYLLSSKETSAVAVLYDVAAGLTVLFVGYFGASSHQPRILGAAVISLGLGTLVMSMAHFTAPPYDPGSSASQTMMCSLNAFNKTCDANESQAYLKNYLWILLLGQALNGFGGTCLYSLGVTYLDESVSTKSSPLYIGIMSGASIFGPAIGYIAGGYFLEFYVDPGRPVPYGMTSSHPAWVGAWWLGFIISSMICFILAGLLFFFPRELPGTKAIRAAKVSQAYDNGSEDIVNRAGFGMTWKDMPKAAWFLLKNPTYLCITATVAIELILAAGLSTFLPKFIANQFNQSSSWAAIITGLLAVPGCALGQITGGFVCKKMNLRVAGMLKLTLISSCIAFMAVPVFWARCQDSSFAGVLVPYPNSENFTLQSMANTNGMVPEYNLNAACNAGCGCSTNLYEPVCGGGVQYFSACHAGCVQEPKLNEKGYKVYHNCSCPGGNRPGASSNETVITAGLCDANCSYLYTVFVPVGFLLFFFTFMMGSPLTVATLRVVPEKQRAFAVGLQWVFLRFLGSIPGPVLYGTMIDASCTLWDEDCGVKGSCWVYNGFEMSKRVFILSISLKAFSILFTVISLISYRPPKTYADDNSESDSKSTIGLRTKEVTQAEPDGI